MPEKSHKNNPKKVFALKNMKTFNTMAGAEGKRGFQRGRLTGDE